MEEVVLNSGRPGPRREPGSSLGGPDQQIWSGCHPGLGGGVGGEGYPSLRREVKAAGGLLGLPADANLPVG